MHPIKIIIIENFQKELNQFLDELSENYSIEKPSPHQIWEPSSLNYTDILQIINDKFYLCGLEPMDEFDFSTFDYKFETLVKYQKMDRQTMKNICEISLYDTYRKQIDKGCKNDYFDPEFAMQCFNAILNIQCPDNLEVSKNKLEKIFVKSCMDAKTIFLKTKLEENLTPSNPSKKIKI